MISGAEKTEELHDQSMYYYKWDCKYIKIKDGKI